MTLGTTLPVTAALAIALTALALQLERVNPADGPAMASSGMMHSDPRPQGAPMRQLQEWSAVRKRRYYRARVYHAPRYTTRYATPAYGRLGDPSLGPNGLPYRRPYDLGGCIIDEGYGRFSGCSDR